jgi:hypothetical protein
MRSSIRKIIAATAAGILLCGVSTSPAFADTWAYPGGVYCSQQTATTASYTTFGASVQHRAQGYGGYYYASWAAGFWPSRITHNWGWYDILSSRVGTTGDGGQVHQWAIRCTA